MMCLPTVNKLIRIIIKECKQFHSNNYCLLEMKVEDCLIDSANSKHQTYSKFSAKLHKY